MSKREKSDTVHRKWNPLFISGEMRFKMVFIKLSNKYSKHAEV